MLFSWPCHRPVRPLPPILWISTTTLRRLQDPSETEMMVPFGQSPMPLTRTSIPGSSLLRTALLLSMHRAHSAYINNIFEDFFQSKAAFLRRFLELLEQPFYFAKKPNTFLCFDRISWLALFAWLWLGSRGFWRRLRL